MPPKKDTLLKVLRWSETYTKTDMLYLACAGFWGNLNAFVIALFSLGLYVAYAHFLPKESYGTYQYLLSWFSIATAFTLTGVNTAVIRATAQGFEGTLRASVPLQLRFGLLPFLIGGGLALYYWQAGNALLAVSLLVIGLLTPPLYAFNTYGAFLIGKKDFRRSTLWGMSASTIYYATLALAAFLSHSPLVLLVANLGIQVCVYVGFYLWTLKVYRPNNKVDKGALSYGLHLSAMGMFGSVAGQLGNIYIFHFLGPASLALYSFASAVPERLGNIFFKFLGNATLPKFSERTVEQIRAELWRKMLISFGAGSVVAVGYALIAQPFFTFFFPTYMDAVPYTLACAVGLAFGAVIYLPLNALTALQYTRALYIYSVLNPIAQIVFPLVGILVGGLWGYLIAHICTIIFANVVCTILVYKASK